MSSLFTSAYEHLIRLGNQRKLVQFLCKLPRTFKEVKDKCGAFIFKLKQVADAMTNEVHAGLTSKGGSELKMLIREIEIGKVFFIFCVCFFFIKMLIG